MESTMVESCLVLSEVCKGLMTRVSFMKRSLRFKASTPHCLNNTDWDKLRKALLKSDPEMPSDLESISKFDTFKSSAGEIMTQLHNFYGTFIDLQELQEKVVETITKIPAMFRCMKLTVNPGITRAFMNLVVDFIKLHYYLSTIDEIEVILCLYATSSKITSGRPEEKFKRLTGYIKTYRSPLRAIFDDFNRGGANSGVVQAIGEIIIEVRGAVDAYNDAQSSVLSSNKNRLDLVDDVLALAFPTIVPLNPSLQSDKNSDPVVHLFHREIARVEEYKSWIVYGVLTCPQLLMQNDTDFNPKLAAGEALFDSTTNRVMASFKTVASDCLVIPVFRELVLDVHKEFEAVTDWFPSKVKKLFNFSKEMKKLSLSKVAKDIAKDAAQLCGKKHRERRYYVFGESEKQVSLLKCVPGVVAPKFPVILATISMMQAEIIFAIIHLANLPKKNKYLDPESFATPKLPEMIRLFVTLTDLVRGKKSVVQDYYALYLQTTHASKLEKELPALREHISKGGGAKAVQIIDSFSEQLRQPTDTVSRQDMYKALRVNWGRLEGILTAADRGGDYSNIHTALNRMDMIVEDSRFVDMFDTLMENHCQVASCCWYWEEFQKVFLESIDSNLVNAKSCLHFVTVISSNVYSLSDFCPEEAIHLQEEGAKQVEKILQQTMNAVGVLLDEIFDGITALDGQTDPLTLATNHYRTIQAAKSTRKGVDPQLTPAGQESFYSGENLPEARKLTNAEQKLCAILSGFNEAGEIPIFNYTFAPKEGLRAHLTKKIVSFVKELFNTAGALDPPTILEKKVLLLFSSMMRAAAYVDLDVPHLVRQALFEGGFEKSNFEFETVGTVGRSIAAQVGKWYVDLIDSNTPSFAEKNTPPPHFVFSGVSNAFISIPGAAQSKNVARGFKNENHLPWEYLDKMQFESLTRVFGAHGSRVIDEVLCEYISKQVQEIQDLIERLGVNQYLDPKIRDLSQIGYSGIGADWITICSGIPGLNEIVEHSIRAGNALAVRQILAHATKEVANSYVPFLAETMNIAFLSTTGLSEFDISAPKVTRVAQTMCHTFGVEGSPDVPLMTALLPHARNDLLSNIPIIFAAFFMSDVWKNTGYVTEIDAFANNEHMTVFTLLALLSCRETSPSDGAQAFIQCASSLVLNVANTNIADVHVPEMIVFIDKFTDACSLPRSTVERCLPYSVVHNARMSLTFEAAVSGKEDTEEAGES